MYDRNNPFCDMLEKLRSYKANYDTSERYLETSKRDVIRYGTEVEMYKQLIQTIARVIIGAGGSLGDIKEIIPDFSAHEAVEILNKKDKKNS